MFKNYQQLEFLPVFQLHRHINKSISFVVCSNKVMHLGAFEIVGILVLILNDPRLLRFKKFYLSLFCVIPCSQLILSTNNMFALTILSLNFNVSHLALYKATKHRIACNRVDRYYIQNTNHKMFSCK